MSATRPVPGFVRTTLESARQTLVLLRHQRLWRVVAATLVVVFVLSYVMARGATGSLDHSDLYCVLAWWLVGTVLLPWATLYIGVQAVHAGIEDRTSQYLFVRPVGRAGLLCGKWMAVLAVAAGLAWLGASVPFFAMALRPDGWADGVDWRLPRVFGSAFSISVLAYSAVAVWFGARFRRPLVWAAFFVVGLQVLAGNLPVSAGLRRLTIIDPMRRIILDGIEPDSKLTELLWPAERRLGLDHLGRPYLDLLLFAAVALALALWSYCRTEYESRHRE